jgi:hypothetical protein
MIKKVTQLLFTIFILIVYVPTSSAQSTQTIRGRVVDEVAKTPLIGVTILITTVKDKTLGSSTDVDGYYRIENVPLGRQTLRITYVGYEEQTIPNIIVTAGKEVVMNIALTESISELNEVVVVADSKEDKTATNNDLAVVSARSFNVDDTKRYAGALGDPSRMAANFAGVVGGNDSRNDIVVRGNTPTGMLWQLEGLNIPNPNHFGALVSTGGPVSMLNNNNLDKSDFMTSAFPAQYGNANAGVFDIRLRDGNNEKREYLAQVGFNGFELGAEGPLSKNSKASYIVNYRYSTLGVFQALGIQFGTGSNTPLYQDLNFKFTLPTAHNGKWIIFGVGGISEIDLLGSKADLSKNSNLYGDENEDSYPRYKTGILGVSYEKNLTPKTFVKFTGGVSGSAESFRADSLVRNSANDVVASYQRYGSNFKAEKYSFNVFARTKYSSKNSLTYGFYIDVNQLNLFSRASYANLNVDTVHVDVNNQATLSQGYATWRHRFNNALSLNTGIHAQHYSLNNKVAVEPRISMQYLLDMNHSLSFGYGMHNQTQNFYTTFVQTKSDDGSVTLSNKDLGFSTSHHYVLTYDWNITQNVRLKAETYYQTLSNVPVEKDPSAFSALNMGADYNLSDKGNLVNNGTGRNYGLELTIERFFSKGYFFLVTTSIFDSKYKGSDGVLRNTAFNTQYVVNTLAGKEWRVGKKRNFLAVNLKLTTIGGKYLTPIDFELSQQYKRTIYKESQAFSDKQDPYFRTDLKISYRKEYKKSTLEVSMDLQNLTNHQNIFAQSYNARTNSVVTQYQQTFFPVPYVRFTF